MIPATAMNCPLPRPVLAPLVLAIGVFSAMPQALADEWAVVMRDAERRVEIDRATIIQSDGGTKVAWGRVVMSPAEATKVGYTTVKALNRYDCMNRGFFTIKRVYLDAENLVLREETVVDQNTVMVARNSVDERMWREVCRPPSVQDLAKVAEQADRAATAAAPPARTAERKPAPGAEAQPAAKPRTQAAPEQAGAEVRQADLKPDDNGVDVIERTIGSRMPEAVTPAAAPMPAQRALPTPPPPTRVAAAAATARSTSRASAPARPSAASAPAAWTYEGATGPEVWGRMRPEWAACAEGRRQSPIDLRDGIGVELEAPVFDFRETRFRVSDTGKTLAVRVGEGMGMEVRGARYGLESFAFHRPSEIRIDGRASDMAVHFALRTLEGQRAVLVVQLERSERANPVLQAVLNNLPLERGGHYMPAEPIDLGALLPPDGGHYLFMGSLSEPPCSEGVLWVVMKQPQPVSDAQLAIFTRLYGRNARPVQPVNDRLVLESR